MQTRTHIYVIKQTVLSLQKNIPCNIYFFRALNIFTTEILFWIRVWTLKNGFLFSVSKGKLFETFI